MSAVLQAPIRDSKVVPDSGHELTTAPSAPRDNPLELLRDVIAHLNSPDSGPADHNQMANLLAEVKDALERARAISAAVAQSEELARGSQFESAIGALNAALAKYPDDSALLAKRTDLEQRQRASLAAATAQTALDEAEWLLGQDRVDLAASFLKEKAADLPDQPALMARLKQVEALLPQWTEDRQLQSALGRVAALEDLQEWQVALTIVEEAMRSHSASAGLTDEARRIRDRLAEHERQTRLARRIELIRQKVSAESWKQAGALLESAQKEFPNAAELEPLRRIVSEGLKRSECEAVIAEVRQCLADGELDQAEQVLRRGLRTHGREAAFDALRLEIDSERKYRDELRNAQLLFGRRQLAEAEKLLSSPVFAHRTEASALLDAVRQARAENEEENFLDRGREKALKLMQQQQYAQAIDLLRNLQALFPGNPILERDLAAAQGALAKEPTKVVAAAEEAQSPVPQFSAPMFAGLDRGSHSAASASGAPGARPGSRFRTAIAALVSLGLIAAAGTAWTLNRKETSVLPRPAAPPTPTPAAQTSYSVPAPVAAPAQPDPPKPEVKPAPQPNAATASATQKGAPTPNQPEILPGRTPRQFVPPPAKQTAAKNPVMPAPPETEANVSVDSIGNLPIGFAGNLTAVAPPPPRAVPAAPAVPVPAPKPVVAVNAFKEAQLVSRTTPLYPTLALQRHIDGVVEMEVSIDERGNVAKMKLVRGNMLLTAAAMDAVKTWKYKPATLNGKPVESSATVKVDFGAVTGK